MPAVADNLADALKVEIDGGTYTAPHASITCEVVDQVTTDLADVSTVKVSIVARGEASSRRDRTSFDHEYVVATVVQMSVDPDDLQTDVRALKLLVMEINDQLKNAARLAGCALMSSEQNPYYDADLLNEQNLFRNVTEHRYEKRRALD